MKNFATRTCAAMLLTMFSLACIVPGASAATSLPVGNLIVTLTSPASGSTVSGTVPVSASVSIVGSLTVAKVEFFADGNSIGSDSTSPYSVTWNTKSVGNGSHTLTAVAQDVLGLRWTSNAVTVTVANDTTPPAVTINRAAGQADPASTSPINFTVIFSEPVSGFTGTDVSIGGTAGGTKTVSVSGGPSIYNAAVSGMTTSGTVIATVPARRANDAAGNPNTASNSTDNSVQFNLPDTTPPAVTINQAAGQADPASTSPINFTVIFSEPVNGFTGTDVSIGGTAGGTKTVTVSGGPSTYNAAVSGMTTSGTVIATIPAGGANDAAGNPNTASTSTDNSVQFNASGSKPTITGFSPTSGPVDTRVTISGTNFSGATSVTFNSTIATFTVDSSTSITATVPNGATTGPISVTTPQGTATSANSFSVTGSATVTRFEETAAAYAGNGWTQRGAEIAAFSGGTAESSNVAGDTATLTFTGTAVKWIGLKCNVCGIASVSIDGGPATSVDTAGPAAVGSPGLTSEVVYASPALQDGSHTMMIMVTGNTTSGDAHVVVDAFDVTGGSASTTTRYEENNAVVSYTGYWEEFLDSRVSGGRVVEAFDNGAQSTVTFTGTKVSWIGVKGDFGAIANVILDGVSQGLVDTYCDCGSGSPRAETQVVMFTASGLAPGVNHTLTIEATGTANPAATAANPGGNIGILVDAFDVTR